MRIALVANRASGGGLDPAPLAAAMDGAEVFGCDESDLERVREWGPDRVAVAGGDGTLGPVAELAGALGVPLAVIPTGTANDFARAHGLPIDVMQAARLAVIGHRAARAGAGRLADGRPFVNVASAGLSSVAARRAQPLKSRFGPLAYGLGAARAALTGRPLKVRVTVDDAVVFDDGAWQVMVACTGAFGGGSGIGVADATDGDLDVVIIPAGSRIGLVKRAWGLRTKRLERQRRSCTTRARWSRWRCRRGPRSTWTGSSGTRGMERVTARAAAFSLVVPA